MDCDLSYAIKIAGKKLDTKKPLANAKGSD